MQIGYEGTEDRKAFFGIGFGKGGVPIDVAGLYVLGNMLGDFSFLMVDTFPALNGESPEDTKAGLGRMEQTLQGLGRAFGPIPSLCCSDFFDTAEYRGLFEQTKGRVLQDTNLKYMTVDTIPARFRGRPESIEYPIHEYACVEFMGRQGFAVKVGQDREKMYDDVMKRLIPGMAYLHTKKAYDLSQQPREVTPYMAKPDEVRILMSDAEDEAIAKLGSAAPQSLKYLATIGAIAGDVLGRDYMNPKSIVGLQGIDRLRDVTARMVMDNILFPYRSNGGV